MFLQKRHQGHPAVNKSTDYSNYYQGLWDCVAGQHDELSFKRGDVVYILSKEMPVYPWISVALLQQIFVLAIIQPRQILTAGLFASDN
ncbi:UNVERIFIED_CONTAM: hypothetical protein FKN15_016989 [Acipenser sinensis]